MNDVIKNVETFISKELQNKNRNIIITFLSFIIVSILLLKLKKIKKYNMKEEDIIGIV